MAGTHLIDCKNGRTSLRKANGNEKKHRVDG